MIDHISYSYLHLLACPYAAWLRYEAALRGPTTPWLALGNAIHHSLEVTHREGAFNDVKAVALFKEEFARIIEEEEVFVNYPQMKKLESEGIEMLVRYRVQIDNGDLQDFPLAVEKEFEIPIAGTRIVGRIDKVHRIDGKLTVTDYKTGKAKPDLWDLRHNPQFTTYYWAAYEIYGEYPRLFWHHLRTGELLETERTALDIVQLQEMVVNAVFMREQGIKHRVFHEKVCGWCDYKGAICDDVELENKILGA